MAATVEQDAHSTLQDRLRVVLISTPNDRLMTCRPDESIREAKERSVKDDFDFLPVTDKHGAILGVFNTKQVYPEAKDVSSVYQRLAAELFIGGDASIMDFVESAHHTPFRFVVSKDGISGIVTLSDLQKFPTRASLFTLIMDFEMCLSSVIDVLCGPHLSDWREYLDEKLIGETEGLVKRAKREGRYVNDLLVTSLIAKMRVVGELIPAVKGNLSKLQEPLRGLRNRLAHADVLDGSRDGLGQISLTVRDVIECRRQIEEHMERQKHGTY